MKCLLGVLIALNVADALLTTHIIKLGVGGEGNPFLLTVVGQPYFIILKVISVVLCAFILRDIYRRHPRLALLSTSCFVAFYGLTVLWNSNVLLG